MQKIFRRYEVWPRFPTISMSGNACALHCKHCDHQYLSDMHSCITPDALLNQCRQFAEQKAVGVLLSGGCDKHGRMLNLKHLLPTIEAIKNETDLIIKLHTGLVDRHLAEGIVSAGVDIASLEVVGDNHTIREIFDFSATISSYQHSLEYLHEAGMSHIVPHVCIGLHYGKLKGETKALQIIQQSCDPSCLVMIVFRPTKHTALEHCPPPTAADVGTVVSEAHQLFPKVDIALGCIRPRTTNRDAIEQAAVDAGVTRMELPSKKTISYVQQKGFTLKTIHACCALPSIYEQQAEDTITQRLHAHSHP